MRSIRLFKLVLVLLLLSPLINQTAAFNNEIYVNAMNNAQIAEKLESNGQFDEAIGYYKKAEKLFNESNDENDVAVAKQKIGVVYGKKGDYDIALEYLQEGRQINHKLNDLPNEIAAIGNSGKIYLLKGDLDNAFLLFNESFGLSQKIGDTHGEGIALANIGAYYREKGDLNTAVDYNQKSLDILLNTSDLYNAGGQAIIISSIYVRLQDLNNAEKYIEQAKGISERINDSRNLKYIALVSSDIYYVKASYYSASDNFQESIKNFYSAEMELRKAIDLPQAKFSYAYILMKEGDLLSRNESHDKAIEKFNEALGVLHKISTKDVYSNQVLADVENLLSAKINFEKGIIATNNLNFKEAVDYFGESEISFKQILNATSMKDKKKLIGGYVYYASSKKNYFLFKTTANDGYRALSQDDLKKAEDLFEEAGFRDLARTVIKEKIINFPESFIPYKDDMILFEGLGFQKIQFNESLKTFESGYITFNYKYMFNIPYDGLPVIKFCCDEFCSESIKIRDNEIRQVKIKILSDYSRKIDCDIKIYSENKPDLSLGTIEDSYYPDVKIEPKFENGTIFFEVSDENPYKRVIINIDKPLYEKIIDTLKLPQTVLGIISGLFTLFTIYKKRNYIKNTLRSIYFRLRNYIHFI